MVEWKKLGEVCSLKARIGWQGLTQKEHKITGDYLLVTGTDFTSNHQVDFDHCVYVDENRYTQDPNIQLRPNDVLITKDGTLGKMAIIENLPKPATLNGGLFVIRDISGKIHQKFLLHYMLSSKFQSIIESNHTNGTIKHLTQALLTNFPFPIPSLEEQQRIVAILDTFTSSIENLKQQIVERRKQYEYYRDSLFSSLTSCEVNQLNDLCSLITKQTGFDYSKTIKPALVDKKDDNCISFIQNKDFEGTRINLNTDYYIPLSIAKQFPKILLNSTILLVSISGRIGNVGLYDIDDVSFVGGAICVCRLNGNANGRYILYYLQSNKGQSQLVHSVKAASHANITVEDIRKIQIPIPSVDEQSRIVSILDTFEASIANLEAQLKEREKQYEYYRNKLLTFE